MPSSVLVTAFCRNAVYDFVRDNRQSYSFFGGPIELGIKGVRYGSKPLHHIVTISPVCIPALKPTAVAFSGLPLIYGMCYDGCRLRYKQTTFNEIKLLSANPSKSSADWPYRDYPPLLPYMPLKILKRRTMRYSRWASAFPNIPSTQPSDLVVAVPPPFDIGVSMWGSCGDAEGVTIIFECDFDTRVVDAYNICT